MAPQPTFGRRRKAQAPRTSAPAVEHRSVPASPQNEPDAELEAWKQARPPFAMPWRQIALMAGLCFTIASFVLPDSVSDIFVWILYGLSGASFYAGWRGRKSASSRS
jgi:hypothetical protein